MPQLKDTILTAPQSCDAVTAISNTYTLEYRQHVVWQHCHKTIYDASAICAALCLFMPSHFQGMLPHMGWAYPGQQSGACRAAIAMQVWKQYRC